MAARPQGRPAGKSLEATAKHLGSQMTDKGTGYLACGPSVPGLVPILKPGRQRLRELPPTASLVLLTFSPSFSQQVLWSLVLFYVAERNKGVEGLKGLTACK